jgi:hypothetical protein
MAANQVHSRLANSYMRFTKCLLMEIVLLIIYILKLHSCNLQNELLYRLPHRKQVLILPPGGHEHQANGRSTSLVHRN